MSFGCELKIKILWKLGINEVSISLYFEHQTYARVTFPPLFIDPNICIFRKLLDLGFHSVGCNEFFLVRVSFLQINAT